MEAVEKKVQECRENFTRVLNLRKELIQCEIRLSFVKEELKLSTYDWKQLLQGELKEREAEVKALIDKTPNYIKNRDGAYKKFKIALLEKGISMNDVVKATDVDINRIYRMLRNINTTKDTEAEKTIENYLGVKVF